MLKTEKEKVVQELCDKLQRARGIYLADFTGLDVASITELRQKLRSASVELRVVKNTLARRAVDEAGIPELRDWFDGPICLAFGYDDPIVPARVLFDFVKDHVAVFFVVMGPVKQLFFVQHFGCILYYRLK